MTDETKEAIRNIIQDEVARGEIDITHHARINGIANAICKLVDTTVAKALTDATEMGEVLKAVGLKIVSED